MSFTGEWTDVERSEVPCRRCGVPGHVQYIEWESYCGGYEDIKYRCAACGGDWWVEGPDA